MHVEKQVRLPACRVWLISALAGDGGMGLGVG